MTVYIASRHEGAIKWLQKHGYTGIIRTSWTKQRTEELGPEDIVVGNLPIYVIDKILKRGAKMILIGIPGWSSEKRQETERELTAEELEKKGAYLTEIKKIVMVPIEL